MSLHDWRTLVKIPVHVIKNEDDRFLFQIRMPTDTTVIEMNHFSEHSTGCDKCGELLLEVFGVSCEVE